MGLKLNQGERLEMQLFYDTVNDSILIKLSDTKGLHGDVEILNSENGIPTEIKINHALLNDLWPIREFQPTNPIKSLRTKLGLTQAELAEILDVSKPRISQLENNPKISPKTFDRIRSDVRRYAVSHWSVSKKTEQQLSSM